MKASEIDAQYATGLSRQGVEQALLDAGKDMGRLSPADLDALEDFHTMGRIATGQLAELARITSRDRVLDAGTGIGGTARFLAATYGCQVTAIDLTREYWTEIVINGRELKLIALALQFDFGSIAEELSVAEDLPPTE